MSCFEEKVHVYEIFELTILGGVLSLKSYMFRQKKKKGNKGRGGGGWCLYAASNFCYFLSGVPTKTVMA